MFEKDEENRLSAGKEHNLKRVNAEIVARLTKLKKRVTQNLGEIPIVQNLKEELEASLALKRTLEIELEAFLEKRAKEHVEQDIASVTTEPESNTRVVEELQYKISLVEEDRDKVNESLADAKIQIETLQEELREQGSAPVTTEPKSDTRAVEELQHKISLVEEDRDKVNKSLADAKIQIETLQEELRWHVEKVGKTEAEIKKLREEKTGSKK